MTQDSNVLKRVLANAGTLLGGRTVNALVGLAYIAMTARGLGAVQMGMLVLINAYAQFLGDVAKFQSWQTVLQYGTGALLEDDRPRFQQVLRFSMLLDLIGAAVGVALGVGGALLLGSAFGWPKELAPAAALYALSIAMMTSATSVGLLRLFDRFRFLAAEQAVSSTVRLIGCAVAFAYDASIGWFLAAWAAGTVASFLYVLGVAWWDLARRELLQGFTLAGPLSEGLPGAWRFAWATNFNGSLDTAFTHVITLVVGAVLGPAQAALWRVGRQVADGMAKPAKLLVPALYPELAKLKATGGEKEMHKLAGQIGVMGGAVAGVLLLVCVLFGGPLLTLVMGKPFAAAAPIMTWQVAAAAIGMLALPLEPMLVSMNKAGFALRVRGAVCAIYLVALVPIIRALGLTGAGVALVAAAAAMALGMFWALRRSLAQTSAAKDDEQTCADRENGAKGLS
ncbi:teichoic acid transporter [Caulobacter sp. Root655]|uniref:lipopolysaccharide biosynthesis protein n=1 Tax=Caulobacter sp. Root655 TaxID=1736578 RepID=UPI0006F252F1|nr:lipopolysaccharide biosynthesis protein [Caulobacter sp. Root655]KRA59415.1 teichoic acid transporter [Caulobacter sp. Root655]